MSSLDKQEVYKTFVGTLHCALENGADLHVNEHQKIRDYCARSTEERRRRSASKQIGLIYRIFYLHSSQATGFSLVRSNWNMLHLSGTHNKHVFVIHLRRLKNFHLKCVLKTGVVTTLII